MQATAVLAIGVVVVAVLLFVAPLGIWNRLIRMHRDSERHAKELAEQLKRLDGELKIIANYLSRN